MQIKIAIPTYQTVETKTAECLTMIQTEGSTHVQFHEGTLVDIARECLTMSAINDGTDYILWLDSDMVFEPDALIRLLADIKEKDCDVVTGLCFSRHAPYSPCIWKSLKMSNTPENRESVIYTEYPKDELFEIDACGMAFCLMKVDVAKAVMERYGACFDKFPGYGEDLTFCLKAKMLGYHIWCDSSVKIGHLGKMVYDEKFYAMFKKFQADDYLQEQAQKINQMATSSK